ncbi:MAG TPA: histone deacetylase [Planctomycetota bacterium]|nr:histone deacetylase [Planctomycetota bacterium]
MTLLVTDPIFLQHVAPHHPERPERLVAILERFRVCGLLRLLDPLPARDATAEELAAVHDPAYVARVRDTAERGGGWFDADTYVTERSWDAAVRAAGGTLAAAEALRDGRDRTAFCAVRPPGHHATPGRGMGFCLFNNAALAARLLRRPVLIVDWDVHHGNGTQDIFAGDPLVRYVSTHRAPFYPGTGAAEERGVGNLFNVPLPSDVSRDDFLDRFRSALEAATRGFWPETVVVSCGFDAYAHDPIGGLGLEPDDYRTMTDAVRALGAPVLSVLEGGYDLEGLGLCAEQHVRGLLA